MENTDNFFAITQIWSLVCIWSYLKLRPFSHNVSVEKVKVRNLGNSHCDTRWGCHGTYHSVSSSVQDWHRVFFSYNPYHWFDCFLISHKITKLRKIDWGSWERLVQKLLQDINNTIISLMYQYRIRYCYNILPILS